MEEGHVGRGKKLCSDIWSCSKSFVTGSNGQSTKPQACLQKDGQRSANGSKLIAQNLVAGYGEVRYTEREACGLTGGRREACGLTGGRRAAKRIASTLTYRLSSCRLSACVGT